MKISDKIKAWLGIGMYILTDPEDGSITLGRVLYERMQEDCGQKLDEVFGTSIGKHYGWVCNPKEGSIFKDNEHIPTAKVQYNAKHKCIGFMLTSPTLARIYYDYDLPDRKLKLRVKRCVLPKLTYYRIEI